MATTFEATAYPILDRGLTAHKGLPWGNCSGEDLGDVVSDVVEQAKSSVAESLRQRAGGLVALDIHVVVKR